MTKQRRALTHVGGPTQVSGDPEAAAHLAAALDVASSLENEEAARAHVHGFHPYPARMHPATAARLIAAFSSPGDVVLDPFCGSGTVLVEARLAGRGAVGVDANPLAVRLAILKVDAAPAKRREMLVGLAEKIAADAEERRKAKLGATRRYGPEDVALFAPHVLMELDGLRAGIERIDHGWARGALSLVLSAILTKVSLKASETSTQRSASGGGDARRFGASAAPPRRVASGFPTRLFVAKAKELAERLAEVEPALHPTPLTVLDGDARRLDGVKDGSIALVVTSPPYAGVYDYAAHHEARLRWLGLRGDSFADREIGSRRALASLDADAGRASWNEDMRAVLGAVRRALKPGGMAVFLMSDSVVGGAPLRADALFRRWAPRASLAIVAIASQARPHFHRPTARVFEREARMEHAIVVRTA